MTTATEERFPSQQDSEHTVLLVDGPEDWWWLTERDASALLDCGLATTLEQPPGTHRVIAPSCAFDVACAVIGVVPKAVMEASGMSPLLAVVVAAVEHAGTHKSPQSPTQPVGRA